MQLLLRIVIYGIVLRLMTEVVNSSGTETHVDDHMYNEAVHASVSSELMHDIMPPRLEDLDKAYSQKKIKYARAILDRLMHHEAYTHSPREQSRIALHHLAHPVYRQIAIETYGGNVPLDLAKDVEAVYCNGVDQLGVLLNQEAMTSDKQTHDEITGSLSELMVFLLVARGYKGNQNEPYLIVPSAEHEDWGKVSPEGIHHGFDFKVKRRRDGVMIPLQVKTAALQTKEYADDILVVSVAQLVRDKNAVLPVKPIELAQSMYLELHGARQYNSRLINVARTRLLAQVAGYEPKPKFQ